LQAWQLLAETYTKIQTERRELAVPGVSRLQQHQGGEVLFTEEDVRQQRMENNLQRISMSHPHDKSCQMGGTTHTPQGLTFPSLSCRTPGISYLERWKGHGALQLKCCVKKSPVQWQRNLERRQRMERRQKRCATKCLLCNLWSWRHLKRCKRKLWPWRQIWAIAAKSKTGWNTWHHYSD